MNAGKAERMLREYIKQMENGSTRERREQSLALLDSLVNAYVIAFAKHQARVNAVMEEFLRKAESYMNYHTEKFYSLGETRVVGLWPAIHKARADLKALKGEKSK